MDKVQAKSCNTAVRFSLKGHVNHKLCIWNIIPSKYSWQVDLKCASFSWQRSVNFPWVLLDMRSLLIFIVPPPPVYSFLSSVWCSGVQEEADRGAAAGRASAEAAAAGASVPGVTAAAAAGAAATAAGQEAAVPLQRPGARQQRQARLGQRGSLHGLRHTHTHTHTRRKPKYLYFRNLTSLHFTPPKKTYFLKTSEKNLCSNTISTHSSLFQIISGRKSHFSPSVVMCLISRHLNSILETNWCILFRLKQVEINSLHCIF